MRLLITKCSDSLLWYRDLVGEYVPLLREYDDCYMSREPAGYANIVRKEDAKLVEDEDI
jgi:hypothetical protein